MNARTDRIVELCKRRRDESLFKGDKSLNVTRLADLAGVTQPTLKAFLDEVTDNPRTHVVKALADFFRVSEAYIRGEASADRDINLFLASQPTGAEAVIMHLNEAISKTKGLMLSREEEMLVDQFRRLSTGQQKLLMNMACEMSS